MLEKRFSGIFTNWEDYKQLFASARDERYLGEASACYLWSRQALSLIAESVPTAQIMVMLRGLAERAFSQYLHGDANGAIRWSFCDHIDRNVRHRSEQICVHFPFLEFGASTRNNSMVTSKRFGRNVRVGLFEDFRSHPVEIYQTICRFLNVTLEFLPDASRRHLAPQSPRLRAISWLRRRAIWDAAARLTPRHLRLPLRRMPITNPEPSSWIPWIAAT